MTLRTERWRLPPSFPCRTPLRARWLRIRAVRRPRGEPVVVMEATTAVEACAGWWSGTFSGSQKFDQDAVAIGLEAAPRTGEPPGTSTKAKVSKSVTETELGPAME